MNDTKIFYRQLAFAIFAIAFNIGKMYNKTKNTPKNQGKHPAKEKNKIFVIFITVFAFKMSSTWEILFTIKKTGDLKQKRAVSTFETASS